MKIKFEKIKNKKSKNVKKKMEQEQPDNITQNLENCNKLHKVKNVLNEISYKLYRHCKQILISIQHVHV